MPTFTVYTKQQTDSLRSQDAAQAAARVPGTVVQGLATGSAAASANAALIQAAINGGGTVVIPVGTWYSSPLKLNTRNVLAGLGWASILKCANNANAHFITLASATGTEQVSIRDILLDGNKANQTTGDVVHLDNTGYSNTGSNLEDDVLHHMSRVMVRNGKGAGVYITGARGSGQYHDVWSYFCDGIGLYIDSPDNQLTNSIAGWSGKQGVWVTPNGSGTHMTSPKVYLSGKVDAANGEGFHVEFTNSVHLIDAEAQDNVGHGFVLVGTANMRLQGIAERNGTGSAFAGGNGDGIYMATVTDSSIDLLATDRLVGGVALQNHGYNFGSGNEHNIVRIAVGATKTGIAGVGTLSASSDLTLTSRETSLRLPPVGITDTFDTIDGQKWTNLTGTITSVSGRMRLATTSGYSNATTDNIIPFLQRPVVVRLNTVPSAGTGTTQAIFQLMLGTNALTFVVQDAPQKLHMKGTGLTDNSVSYSATNHAWLRLRYNDGTIYWDAAPDASGVPGTWATLSSQAAPAFVTAALMKLQLSSGYYGTESGLAPAYAEFDNLNLS